MTNLFYHHFFAIVIMSDSEESVRGQMRNVLSEILLLSSLRCAAFENDVQQRMRQQQENPFQVRKNRLPPTCRCAGTHLSDSGRKAGGCCAIPI